MQETQNLKLLFEDDFGLSYVHIIDDVDEKERKYVIHSHVKEGFSKEIMPKVLEYSAMVDESFREKGVKKLYTWATNPEEEKYANILGYSLTGKIVTMKTDEGGNAWSGPEVLELSKDLI